jgi:hypothetical protein
VVVHRQESPVVTFTVSSPPAAGMVFVSSSLDISKVHDAAGVWDPAVDGSPVAGAVGGEHLDAHTPITAVASARDSRFGTGMPPEW